MQLATVPLCIAAAVTITVAAMAPRRWLATKGFHGRWIILKDARGATIYDGYYSAEF